MGKPDYFTTVVGNFNASPSKTKRNQKTNKT